MVKRTLCLLLCVLLLSGSALAVRVEQTQAVAPVIDVYLYETEGDLSGVTAQDVTATLEGEKLQVASLAPSTEGISYIYLLDVSASLPRDYFAAAKAALLDSYANLGPDDELALITFGDTVNTVLRGGESEQEVRAAIEPLNADNMNTAP